MIEAIDDYQRKQDDERRRAEARTRSVEIEIETQKKMVEAFRPRLMAVQIAELSGERTYTARVLVSRQRFEQTLRDGSPYCFGLPSAATVAKDAALSAAIRKIFGARAFYSLQQIWEPCKSGGSSSITGRVRITIAPQKRSAA